MCTPGFTSRNEPPPEPGIPHEDEANNAARLRGPKGKAAGGKSLDQGKARIHPTAFAAEITLGRVILLFRKGVLATRERQLALPIDGINVTCQTPFGLQMCRVIELLKTAVEKAYQDSLVKRYGPKVRDVEGSTEPPGQLRAVRQSRAHADDLDRPSSHIPKNHGSNTCI